MSLEWAKRQLIREGKPGDSSLAKRLERRIQEHGDLPLSHETTSAEGSMQLVPVGASARGLVPYRGGAIQLSEYAFVEHDPEFIRELLSRFWQAASARIGETVEVPKLIKEEAVMAEAIGEIKREEEKGLGFFYMPPQYSSIEALPKLAEMFPFAQGPYTYKEGSYRYLGEQLINLPGKASNGGWMAIEWQDLAPFTSTSEFITKTVMKKRGLVGQTFNIFIAASAHHKLLTNRFFDEGKMCRLFGTELAGFKGRPVVVSSRIGTGAIVVQDPKKIGRDIHPDLGARTVGRGNDYMRANIDQGIKTYPRVSQELAERDRAAAEALGNIFRLPWQKRDK